MTTTPRISYNPRASTFERARGAYLADWLAGGDDPTFAQWFASVMTIHAQRTPAERDEAAPAEVGDDARVSRSVAVPAEVRDAIQDAIRDDQRAGRWHSTSAWAVEALLAAIAAAETRDGHLPTPPARLPNRLTR